MTHERQHDRIPVTLQVEFRTAGAFLVAYTVNLSTGGMFVETQEPRPIGTQLRILLTVPGAEPVPLEGAVVWIREAPEADKPPGMGIRFVDPVDSRYGEMIDALASKFRGLRVVVMAASAGARAALARGVRSMLATATVVEVADSNDAEAALEGDADLLLIDLDDAGAEGLVALRLAKLRKASVPVIGTARAENERLRAGELGADEVLPNPPAFPDLQAAIIRTVGRPSRIT